MWVMRCLSCLQPQEENFSFSTNILVRKTNLRGFKEVFVVQPWGGEGKSAFPPAYSLGGTSKVPFLSAHRSSPSPFIKLVGSLRGFSNSLQASSRKKKRNTNKLRIIIIIITSSVGAWGWKRSKGEIALSCKGRTALKMGSLEIWEEKPALKGAIKRGK